ncbi:MAG: helix-turn-helix domain-containing protein [Gammaproteobacteria bacterium]|nr:helix-turn-helix domain-containing protein [Gammaproteobacteria bacterium]
MTESVQLLTTKQVAELWGVKPQTLTAWRVQKKGPAFLKIGRAVRYQLSALKDFLASQAALVQDEDQNQDPRLDWKLAGVFVRQGPPNSTLVWRVLEYRQAQLAPDASGKLILVDENQLAWRLIDDAVFMREVLGFKPR